MVKVCGDCIHAEVCKQVNSGWFSPNNPAYCKVFRAAEVVRCRDCIYYREGKIFDGIKFCFRLRGSDGEPVGYNFSDDDFCSRGEPRR